VVGGEFSQLFSMLWGNVSIFPNIRLVDVEFSDEFLTTFPGPKYGLAGLRKELVAPTRPLISTALKPMGYSPNEFAQMATTLVRAGIDFIKDDHGLGNQPWARWHERVEAVAKAVVAANEKYGRKTIYAPSLNVPANEIMDRAAKAHEWGAGALLVLPGLTGLSSVHGLQQFGLPIMTHPSMLGSFTQSPSTGIAHALIYGLFPRMLGADISVFPNVGGRFSFTNEECLSIQNACTKDFGQMSQTVIAPAGGMSIEKLDGMHNLYGSDVMFLIGGALSRGDLYENAVAFAEAVQTKYSN
jgi:ribulose-bisphosphate carboxylase large chain